MFSLIALIRRITTTILGRNNLSFITGETLVSICFCKKVSMVSVSLQELNNSSAATSFVVTLHLYFTVQFEGFSFKIEPRHEISSNVVCATSKTSDQPAHICSLIRAFASRLNIL